VLVVSFLAIGGLLLWQVDMATTASDELQSITGTDTTNIALYLPFFIYFVGIVVMVVVFFWNRRDLQRWFPARKDRAHK